MGGPAAGPDRSYYDQGTYFDDHAAALADPANPFQRYRIARVLKIHTLGPGDRVLDLGCGWGTFTYALAPLCREVVGVDFSSKAVALCEAGARQRGLANARFVCADAGRTGLEAGSFDAVVSADLFEHLYPADYLRVLDECRRVLRPGGRLVVWTPHRGHFLEVLRAHNIILKRAESHVDFKSLKRLKQDLAARGFAVRRAGYAPSHLPVLRIVETLTMWCLPFMRRRVWVLAEKQ